MTRSSASSATLLVAVIAALALCGGLLVYGAGRGVDLTDEIFYLVWTRDPQAYLLIYQPFGYLLHPLLVLVGGDLRAFRLAGFAIAAAAGAVLGASLAPGRHRTGVSALHGALAALTIFFPWIITPSYNSAANVGAMLATAGILTVAAGEAPRRAAGSIAVAAGLCLALFSKPPLFAILVAVIVARAIASRGRATRLALAASGVVAALLVALFLSPAALPGLVARMAASQHILALPNTPLALPGKIAGDWRLVPASLSIAAIAAVIGLATARVAASRWLGVAAIAFGLLYLGSIVPDAIDGGVPDFIGLALVLVAAGYAILSWRRPGVDRFAIALLLAAPVAVALGTFNNQWAQLNFSMAFPLLAIFMLAESDPLTWRAASMRVLGIAGPCCILLLAACYPYSLPRSIFEQQIAIRHPVTHSPVLVDPETAAFVRAARERATGALLVDLSGTGPGVAASLGARAPVLAWLNPATATWPDVVWTRLSPAERERAWFVGPVLPLFGGSKPARWFAAHRQDYCGQALPPLPFWGEERTLVVWRPCRPRPG